MFKRMSILRCLPSDDREAFARKWQFHGTLVSHLPLIRTYVQNHVVEHFSGADGMVQADGIVELRFDRPEDMAEAFASEAAIAVKADEPNFLGHGTGYALANDSLPLESPDGSKLILVLPQHVEDDARAACLDRARRLDGLVQAVQDDVADVIARSEMAQGPQVVSTFFHLLFPRPEIAVAAAREMQRNGIAPTAIFRVRTLRVR